MEAELCRIPLTWTMWPFPQKRLQVGLPRDSVLAVDQLEASRSDVHGNLSVVSLLGIETS